MSMNLSMKKTVKALMVTSLMLALPTIPMANPASDRALFMAGAAGSRPNAVPMVRAGNAVIDDALSRIVPSPYRILLDESVPASMQIVWSAGDNWMNVLTRALAPIGLVAEPDWSKNTITIAWRQKAPVIAPVLAPESNIAAAFEAPEAPVAPVPQRKPNYRDSGFKAGFVAVQQTQPQPQQPRAVGGFVVVKPDARPEVGKPDTAKPDLPTERFVERFTERSTERVTERSIERTALRFTADANGDLPTPSVMWQLMNAAVNGDQIVLSGVSSMGREDQRSRYSSMYAAKLRANLLKVGFPANSVVLSDRHPSDRANKPGVRIMINKGEI